ncbi:MAG: integrase catalytic subunit [archaeon GW2011_AR5]|nr:MAG: integrase catalytic subunit [archaeon GW2011_AR5]
MVKAKGKYVYCWNAIDSDSRFLLASLISEGREIGDARRLFQKVKEVTKVKPSVIITDGLASYPKAIRREFGTR